jgi:hypothetical protein
MYAGKIARVFLSASWIRSFASLSALQSVPSQGAVLFLRSTNEVFEHRYEMPRGGGHCVPGSTAYSVPVYAYGCQPPNGFNRGDEVMRFFQAHPMP